ncbi:Putative ribonuclease H protein At1g65750 [Linum perenne]
MLKSSSKICWIPAPGPAFTLNTDGYVSRSSGKATSRGALRDWQGRAHNAFMANLGTCSITRAELAGTVTGLDRAWNIIVRDIEIQTDSNCAVNLLIKETAADYQHASNVSCNGVSRISIRGEPNCILKIGATGKKFSSNLNNSINFSFI